MTVLKTTYVSLGELDQQTRGAWDGFVEKCSPPHFEQTTMWGDARRTIGWDASVMIIRENDEIIAGAQVLSRRLGRIARVGYISHGPLIKADGEVGQMVSCELKRVARRAGHVYLAVDPPYYGNSLVEQLHRAGFQAHIKSLPPSGLPDGTLLLDLQAEPEALLAQMRSTTRKEIRRGIKKGVTVRTGGAADLPLFWDLLVKLCERRKASPNVPGIAFLRSLWSSFAARNGIDLLIAEAQGSPICALMTIRHGSWSWLWRTGNTPECFDFEGAQVTYWEGIKRARAQGSQVLDFLGLYAPQPGANLEDRGLSSTDNPYQGVNFFKLGFGGRIIEVPAALGIFPNPLTRWAMRLAGERMITSPIVRRVIRRAGSIG